MKSKPCDECGKQFEPSTLNQTTCTQCMIHPHIKKEVPMLQPQSGDKICVDCKKPYTPTGHCQKRCHECGAKASYKSKPEPKKKTADLKTSITPKQLYTKINYLTPHGFAIIKPFIDILTHDKSDSIEFRFWGSDVSISIRRVAK